MKTVAVAGVGLIGASFGLALRRAGFSGRIIGVSSAEAIKAGLAAGAISESGSLEDAAHEADLIYLAQPIDRILDTIQKLGPMVRSECLVTDAGSTKATIIDISKKYMHPGIFLGGHPIAGKEQRGAEAADATLFQNRPYVLTPTEDVATRLSEFEPWLSKIGARVVIMSPEQHDRVVAATSHLPQLLSTALSVTLAQQDLPRLLEVFGPGLLDMTRLSLSSPDIWRSILQTNREEIADALKRLSFTLQRMTAELEGGQELEQLFATGQKFATDLRSL